MGIRSKIMIKSAKGDTTMANQDTFVYSDAPLRAKLIVEKYGSDDACVKSLAEMLAEIATKPDCKYIIHVANFTSGLNDEAIRVAQKAIESGNIVVFTCIYAETAALIRTEMLEYAGKYDIVILNIETEDDGLGWVTRLRKKFVSDRPNH